MCADVLPTCTSVHPVYMHMYMHMQLASEARRGPQSLQNRSYRWLFLLSYYVSARNRLGPLEEPSALNH